MPKGIYIRTEENLKNLSIAQKAVGRTAMPINCKNTGRTHFKKGFTPWNKRLKGYGTFNKGKIRTEAMKKKMSESQKGRMVWNKGKIATESEKKRLSEIGKLGSKKRWEGHIKVEKKYKRSNLPYSEKYKNGLEKKRFTNQRYKARKRDAIGSHTFEEWLVLKQYYGNMCLCCKRTEPGIKLTEDHIIPLSKGGSDFIENIQPLCVSCNTRKFTKNINYLPISEIQPLKLWAEGSVN